MRNNLLTTFILIIFSFLNLTANASGNHTLSGIIKDKTSGEPLTGATILLVGTNFNGVAGLDGSFSIRNIPAGNYTVQISYISYETQNQTVSLNGNARLNVDMEQSSVGLESVQVVSRRVANTEASARATERNAPNVMNVVAQRTIELSPDMTVANVAQRVSGISLERSATGDGQHAIVRGMDKRYNYTLVNGVKIPSPDNNNRYVPLDLFPSDMLERLEVTKSITPDMEADAIGGVVDMHLKDAPEESILNFNVGTGFNTMFFDRDFYTFDRSNVSMESPRMSNAEGYQSTIDDFPLEVANHEVQSSFPLNQIYGLTAGKRFGERKRFGALVAVSHQNTVRGSESKFFHLSTDRETNLPVLNNALEANRSTRQQRTGAHIKLDYRLSDESSISFYSSYMRLAEEETRVMVDTALQLARSGPGTGRIEQWVRSRQRISNIYTNNLQGTHNLSENFSVDWSAVYSRATYDDPDMAEFMTISERRLQNGEFTQTDWVHDNTNHRGFFRRWMGNTDQDIAGYLNLYYTPELFGQNVLFQVGGMVRNKQRENYFDRYRLGTSPAFQTYDGDITNNTFNVVINGSPLHALNYELTENVIGTYAMTRFTLFDHLSVLTGARVEMTDMSWVSNAPSTVEGRIGNIEYTEVLPHLHLKYEISPIHNLRASYYESMSRQGYFEVIPYNFYEEDQYREAGNPNLKHAYARNVDLRYEFFPNALDQIMVGAFYKSIDNPIETAVVRREDLSNRLFLTPQNFGTATNMGFEIDFVKYFNMFGFRGNYTYTLSEITSNKIFQFRDEGGSLTNRIEPQTRPLQGQSAHLANFSFLFKNQNTGTDAQLALTYTGRRIAYISAYKDNDQWQRAFTQLDFSIDQRIVPGLIAYVKVNNILNTPFELEIPASNEAAADAEPHLQVDDHRVLSRSDMFHRTFLFGLRYSFVK
ncbi:MAG: TonB-dependent receptor [Chitinophagaceae bacterium]|nr:MAG: TonB-dependent receptor [Chitinophagaceae bacterium]